MIERTRPQRPPYVPRWLLPAVLGVIGAIALVAVVVVVAGLRSQVTVPDVVGLDESVARVRLAQAGLEMSVGERPFNAAEAGVVLDQSPLPGEELPEGDTVVLVVSEGTEEFPMPDVIGLAARIATAQLEQLGLMIKIEQIESDAPSDTVISTNPSPGVTMRLTDVVRLSVATAPDSSTALRPYTLSGASIVIDPGLTEDASIDVTMEVARRLRSLLEASGASVRVTRSAGAPASGTATASATPGATIAAFVGIDALLSGTGGMAVGTLSATDAGALYRPSYVLADEVEEQLRVAGNIVARESVTDDALKGAGGPGLRIRLGSFDSATDAAAFADPAWADKTARALYRALGERLGAS